MKRIALSGKRGIGLFAAVSDEDFDFLSQWNWQPDGDGYAKRAVRNEHGQSRTVFMHRVIASRMGCDMSFEIDHQSSDKLDNRRSSLRAATHSQNRRNMGARRDSSTGVKGVGFDSISRRYRVGITVNGRRINLGRFKQIDDAKAAYAAAAKFHHGDFARTE